MGGNFNLGLRLMRPLQRPDFAAPEPQNAILAKQWVKAACDQLASLVVAITPASFFINGTLAVAFELFYFHRNRSLCYLGP